MARTITVTITLRWTLRRKIVAAVAAALVLLAMSAPDEAPPRGVSAFHPRDWPPLP